MWRRKGHSWARVPAQLSSVTQSCLTLWCPWTIPHQAFLSITNSQSLLKLMYIFSDAIQRSHPLFLSSPPTFNLSQYQGLSSESALHISWPKYWSFSFSISPSNEYSGLIFFRMDWLISLQFKGLSRVFSNPHPDLTPNLLLPLSLIPPANFPWLRLTYFLSLSLPTVDSLQVLFLGCGLDRMVQLKFFSICRQ